jgi:nucleotidyltransferase/DNA polymerase involved in DNA repair
MKDKRKLKDLVSVGPATLADFKELGITEVEDLLTEDARRLFQRLQRIKEQRVDPCCEDVFRTAIEQARNPKLPIEKQQWFYWSKIRKQRSGK